jgi:hypothetical protein
MGQTSLGVAVAGQQQKITWYARAKSTLLAGGSLSHTGRFFFAMVLLASGSLLTVGCWSVPKHAATPPNDWLKLEAGAFSIYAPAGWEFHKRQGIDSYVGEFAGNGVVLRFDFGRYSNPLDKEHGPTYIVTKEVVGGYRAKIVSPRTSGHGITGVYFRRVTGSNRLCLWGEDLTETQQELALQIFRTIRFR